MPPYGGYPRPMFNGNQPRPPFPGYQARPPFPGNQTAPPFAVNRPPYNNNNNTNAFNPPVNTESAPLLQTGANNANGLPYPTEKNAMPQPNFDQPPPSYSDLKN
jgi:hypothetical protein